ncbi:MAG: rRNA maturation RNAse YbeY [Patescibacteria group bacterium]
MRKVIISLDKKFKKDEEAVKKALGKLDKILGLKGTYLEVYLVKDDFTVHSFEPPKDFPRPDIGKYKNLGEIHLGIKRLPRFARNDGIKFCLIHGLLHLLGYGHKKKSDRIKMEEKEEELCRKIF